MILVTGSTGHLGQAVINYLLEKVPVNSIAALARDENKAADLKAKGVDVRIGTYDDYDSLVKAFKGIDKLLLVSSNDIQNRSKQQIDAINAAKEAGVQHIIYTSANNRNPKDTAIPFIADSHTATEEYLKNASINYTILRNNLYADVLPLFLGEQVLETGVFFPAGNGKIPFANRLNMAEATANILTSDGHENKVYALSSDISYSLTDVANVLSALSGKTVNYVDPTKEVYVETLTNAGVPELYIGMFAGFAEAIKRDEFNLPDNTLEQLLGRKPTSLEEYLQTTFFSNN